MIDWDMPIELDDGREVTLIRKEKNGCAVVNVHGPVSRDGFGGGKEEWYYTSQGIWQGGSKKYEYYIVNSSRPEMYTPEDWS